MFVKKVRRRNSIRVIKSSFSGGLLLRCDFQSKSTLRLMFPFNFKGAFYIKIEEELLPERITHRNTIWFDYANDISIYGHLRVSASSEQKNCLQ